MNNCLDNAADVGSALGRVHWAELGSTFTVVCMGLEDVPITLTLRANDVSHEKAGQNGWSLFLDFAFLEFGNSPEFDWIWRLFLYLRLKAFVHWKSFRN